MPKGQLPALNHEFETVSELIYPVAAPRHRRWAFMAVLTRVSRRFLEACGSARTRRRAISEVAYLDAHLLRDIGLPPKPSQFGNQKKDFENWYDQRLAMRH